MNETWNGESRGITDVMIARIDANVEAIKDALNVVTTNHAKR